MSGKLVPRQEGAGLEVALLYELRLGHQALGKLPVHFKRLYLRNNQMAEKHRAEYVGRGVELAFRALCLCFAAL